MVGDENPVPIWILERSKYRRVVVGAESPRPTPLPGGRVVFGSSRVKHVSDLENLLRVCWKRRMRAQGPLANLPNCTKRPRRLSALQRSHSNNELFGLCQSRAHAVIVKCQ